jgi:hemerythrin-like metal-binding protein
MPFAEWGDEFSIGIDELDADHKKLFALLNDLKKAMDTGNAYEALGRVLSGLKLYMRLHFAHEEELLRLTDYPDYEAHYREHQAFADAVEELHRDFRIRVSDALPRQAFEFLKNWLYQHSLEADRAFAEYLKAKPAMMERVRSASAGMLR